MFRPCTPPKIPVYFRTWLYVSSVSFAISPYFKRKITQNISKYEIKTLSLHPYGEKLSGTEAVGEFYHRLLRGARQDATRVS